MADHPSQADVYRIVDAASDAFTERRIALVGGQALLYWAHEFRETSYLNEHGSEPLASADVDFTGSADEADSISDAMGGKVVVRAKGQP